MRDQRLHVGDGRYLRQVPYEQAYRRLLGARVCQLHVRLASFNSSNLEPSQMGLQLLMLLLLLLLLLQ